MAGHQLNQLIVKAAVDGKVDFSKADIFDVNWHRHLYIIINEMLRQRELEERRLHHQRMLFSLLAKSETADYAEVSKKELEAFEDLIDILNGKSRPASIGERKVAFAKRLKQAWISAFGNPDDPKVSASIEAAAENLKAMRDNRK